MASTMSEVRGHRHGGERRLVTVIVRSQGRATLAGALASVAAQTYPDIEILVVDATGGRHPPLADRCGTLPLRMVATGHSLNRPQAANCGLDHARGDWLNFLDDDDYFDSTHIESLLTTAIERKRNVAYSGTRVLDHRDQVVSELNEPYARLRLFERNYIQMSAALFHRNLLDLGCRFDEDMLLFQDWDFWLQLAMHGDFAHTSTTTTNWRAHSGASGAGAGPNADPELQARFSRRLREKWAGARDRLVAFLGNVSRHANWLLMRRRSQRAVRWLTLALALFPDDPGLLNLLGIAFFHAGHFKEARLALRKAHLMLPDNGPIRRNLALAERAQSRAGG
jgi:glycosyltransferase involved in cell wall biosynthesis